MSFWLWITGDVAWARGAYESRPIGTAVISATDLFKRRDFRQSGIAPSVFDPSCLGLFASLGDLNAALRSRRRTARFGRAVAEKPSLPTKTALE